MSFKIQALSSLAISLNTQIVFRSVIRLKVKILINRGGQLGSELLTLLRGLNRRVH